MLLPGFCAAEDSPSPVLKLNPLVKDFLAGGLAGGLAIACTQPLDTVRVRLQQAAPSTVSAAGRSAAIYAPRAAPDAVSILRNLVRAEGITAPWKGMTAPLVMASVQSAILFQVYGSTLRYMAGSSDAQQTAAQQAQGPGQATQQHSSQQQTAAQDSQQAPTQAAHSHPNPTPYQGMVAGCVAGFAQVWLWSPVELVKVRMQLQSARKGTKGYVGPLALAQRIFKREGVAGLYRGVTATALRDIPSYGMYFGLYHVLLNALEGDIHPDEASPMTHVLAGGTAGLVSWLPVYHIDVIKTRMQATSRSGTPGKTWLDFAKQIYREEGARALLRGMPMTLARAFILDAVVFVAYRTSLKKMDHL